MPQMMTPDGRMVDVPDGMMAHFAGLSLPPDPVMPPMQPGVGIPASAIDAAPITPPEPAPAPAVALPTSPGQVPSDGVPSVPAPDPAPKPITQGQIATMGEAGPLNAQVDALTGAKHAADRLGKAIGDRATAIGMVETAANEAADRQLAEMQRTAESNAKAVQDATNSYVQNAKRLADVRIDHGIDHPVVAAIGTALNILGTAMKKGDMSNIMKPIYDALDRKVAAQMQDIEQGKAGLGLQREAMSLMKQNGNDRVALQNTLMLAGLEQAKRRIQEVKDKTTSPITSAQADQAKAEIDVRIAESIEKAHNTNQQRQDAAAARAQAERLAQAQNYVTMRGQDMQREEHTDTIATQIMLARDSASSAASAKGQAKAAEDIQKRSIGGELSVEKDKDGNVIYNDDGTPKLHVGLITTKNGEVWVPNGMDSTVAELQQQHPVVTALVGTLDEIRRMGPEWLANTANSDKKQKLDQLFSTAKTQATRALGLGVPTGRDIELATGSLGTSDPTRFRDSLAGLQKARDTFVRVHRDRLTAAGLDKEWTITDLGNVPKAPIDEVRTLLKAKPDTNNYDKAYTQALGHYYPKGKVSDAEHREAVTAASAEAVKYKEVSPKQRRAIEKLTEQGLSGDKKAISALTDIASGDGVSSDMVKRLAQEAKSTIESDASDRAAKIGKYAVTSDAGASYDPNSYNPDTLGQRFQAQPSKPTIGP